MVQPFRKQFAHGLREREALLRDLLDVLVSRPLADEVRESLDDQLHKLSGTASTLGFVELAAASRELETLLRDVWDDERRVRTLKDTSSAKALLAELRQGDRSIASGAAEDASLDVVLIDDDPDMRMLVSSVLARAGNVTLRCHEGIDEALATPPGLTPPGIVLLDVRLGGRSGARAFGAIRKHYGRSAPIVFFTAVTGAKDIDRLHALGAADVITKPFDAFGLAARIATIARRHVVGGAAVLIADSRGRIVTITEAARAMLGDRLADSRIQKALGVPWPLAFPRGGGPLSLLCGSSAVPLEARFEPLAGGGARVMIETLRTESAPAHVRTVVESGPLIQGLAHHIRNPLAALHSIVQVLATSNDLPPPAAASLTQIPGLLLRIDAALAGCIALTRAAPSSRRRRSLGELIGSFASGSSFTGLRVDVTVAEETETLVSVDIIQRIVSALAENARQANATELALDAEVVDDDLGARVLVLHVSDNGDGMDAATREAAFDPFFSTRPPQIGLGLTIARKLARDVGGDLFFVPAAVGCDLVLRMPAT